MTTKHTPGPWVVADRPFQDVPTILSGIHCVARAHGRPGHEILANARLIAAAPDMLEAISAHLAWLKFVRHDDRDKLGAYTIAFDKTISQFEAIVAKAEGCSDG